MFMILKLPEEQVHRILAQIVKNEGLGRTKMNLYMVRSLLMVHAAKIHKHVQKFSLGRQD